MHIALTYNLRTGRVEEEAELHTRPEIETLHNALKSLGHDVTLIEVSDQPHVVIEQLLHAEPDLIFNIAEERVGTAREAFYPSIFERMRIPFTGSSSSVLHLNLDKQLTKTVVAAQGVRVPRGVLITKKNRKVPADLHYPLIVKPNYEGSSLGITQKSVVDTKEECEALINELLDRYSTGLVVEEFITGRELTVPLLEAYPGEVLEVVEITFDLAARGATRNIYDFTFKYGGGSHFVTATCPAKLTDKEHKAVVALARKAARALNYSDYTRVDIRLAEDGTPYFIEMNPLPSLEDDVSHMIAARHLGLTRNDVLRYIIRSATRRQRVIIRSRRTSASKERSLPSARPTARDQGIKIGYFEPGPHNAITDIRGVKVGHISYIDDDVPIAGTERTTSVRTGVTAILPAAGDIFNRHIAASGFVLNGTGELVGLSQIMDWGWIETPIMLTNTVSVGTIYRGVLDYMVKRHPQLQERKEVIIPVIGETDDSFLNDVHVGKITPKDAVRAIEAARGGPVTQGSVGAGTGMTSFDFAGGIGTSSRIISEEGQEYTLGVLVLSNFGKMRNLTISGAVVGRDLDRTLPQEGRRIQSYGSVIVVVATDAPLLWGQLSRLSKRAALGLGRVGTYAGPWSGEIIIAFSTANRIARTEYGRKRHLTMRFISDNRIEPFYEAVIEATEEACLNAIFCSGGMNGRDGHRSLALPHEEVLEFLSRQPRISPK